MPFVKVIVHTVWATKDRKPFLTQENRIKLVKHIREYASSKNICLININGYTDHLHALLSLSSDQNIATIMNIIKGESSFWANKNLKFNESFGWQNEYFAVSVSASQFDAVNQYINNQEIHHSKKTWQNEYDAFLKNYEFDGLDEKGKSAAQKCSYTKNPGLKAGAGKLSIFKPYFM